MNRLKALLDKHQAGHLKVWLTEYGYPTQLDPRGVAVAFGRAARPHESARALAPLRRAALHLRLPGRRRRSAV